MVGDWWDLECDMADPSYGEKPILTLQTDEDYWSSQDGIYERLNMLGETVVWDYFNGAVKVSANAFDIRQLQITGPLDERICEYCEGLYDENGEGKVYMVWQFMPYLPAHPGCRHFWDVMIPEEPSR